MKHLFTLCCALLVSVLTFSQENAVAKWELIDSNCPDYIGTSGDVARGLAFAKVDGVKYLFVISRVATGDGAGVYVINPETGAKIGKLPMGTDVISGGNHIISSTGVTEDNVLLVANLTTVSSATSPFKVYAWKSTTEAPQTVLEFTNATGLATSRLGDKLTVTGSFVNKTAKIWAANATLNGTSAEIYCFSMKQGGDTFEFDPVPEVKNIGTVDGAGMASISFRPDGSFLYNSNQGLTRNYNSNGSFVNQAPWTTFNLKSNGTKFIGKSGDDEYFAWFEYSGDAVDSPNFAQICKSQQTNFRDALTLFASTTPMTGNINGSKNLNGTGDIAFDLSGNFPIIYVLATNRGLGAYTLNFTLDGGGTSIKEAKAHSGLFVYQEGSQLRVSEAVQKIELVSITGQKVAVAHNQSEISVNGISGIYLIKVTDANGYVTVRKVLVR